MTSDFTLAKLMMATLERWLGWGRMPNEDALDVTLNWLIRGPGASSEDEDAFSDGVDQATHRSTDTFPYLAELNGF